jgi:hypothetical protein
MVLAAVRNTTSTAGLWAIVIVAVAGLAVWLVMVVAIAPRARPRFHQGKMSWQANPRVAGTAGPGNDITAVAGTGNAPQDSGTAQDEAAPPEAAATKDDIPAVPRPRQHSDAAGRTSARR